VSACGDQGSAEKWAHAAMALAVRALGHDGDRVALEPARVLEIVERVLRDGDAREGVGGGNLAPADARALLRAWLASVGLGELSEADLVAHMQDDRFTHADLYRRATRAHERHLRDAVATAIDAAGRGEIEEIGAVLFTACVPAIPYAPAAAFIARERAKLAPRDGRAPACGDRRGRHRRDARRYTHDRGDPRARRRGLRDRGDRHRSQRRPAADRSR